MTFANQMVTHSWSSLTMSMIPDSVFLIYYLCFKPDRGAVGAIRRRIEEVEKPEGVGSPSKKMKMG